MTSLHKQARGAGAIYLVLVKEMQPRRPATLPLASCFFVLGWLVICAVALSSPLRKGRIEYPEWQRFAVQTQRFFQTATSLVNFV